MRRSDPAEREEMMYECTNCQVKFPTLNAFWAHATDCKLKFKNKPRYKIVDITEGKEMPNRFTTKVHDTLYQFIAARDGNKCLHCGKPPGTGPPLEIDHADGNKKNWDPDNLHLLCDTCNLQFRQLSPEEHVLLISKDSAHNVYVCEREKGNPATQLLRNLVNYTAGSVETKINSHCEVKFRRWLLNVIDTVGFVEKNDCINSGAEYCGCSQVTIERYLSKLTSSMGVLEITLNELNQTVVTRRHT